MSLGLPGDCGDRVDGCAASCEDVFDRVLVETVIEGGTRVSWELTSRFSSTNPGPHEYQLLVGRTANPDANDWEPVGLPATDTWFLIDDEKRVWGATQWTHYRVCLRTPEGQLYFSRPETALGGLSRHDLRLAKEIIRKELLRFRKHAGQRGFLLKRKVAGPPCTTCLDYQTGEVRNPDCEECQGTGFVDGYFAPMPCIWAELSPTARHEELDGGQSRGTINDIIVSARMLAVPHMNENDLWVSEKQDLRWFIHKVSNVAEIRGVALVANVELRLAKFSNRVYSIVMPEV